MSTRAVFRLWCAVCVVLWAACGSEGSKTELLVTVTSDMGVPAELDRVTLSVTGQELERDPEADLRAHPLPRSITLSHDGGPLGPVHVTVRGWLGTALVVESDAVLWFEAGRSIVVPVMLMRACANVMCATDATCVDGRCVATGDAGIVMDGGDGGGSVTDAAPSPDGASPDAGSMIADASDSDAGVAADAAVDDAAASDAGADAAAVDAGTDGSTPPNDSGVVPPVDAGPPPPSAGAAPRCSITTPVAGDTFQVGRNFVLLGTCTDPETGVLSQGLRWASNRDGNLANGASATAVLQNLGNHSLSLCAPDPRDAQLVGCASVAVAVSASAQPSASIIAITQNGAASQPFSAASSLQFTGAGSGASVSYTWTDDIAGALGSGASVTLNAPRVGRHTVTLHVRDRYNVEQTAVRSYIVVAAGETSLVSPLPNVNVALDQAGDPAVPMIASDANLRVYVPNSSGVLFRFDGAALASPAVVAVGQPPLRAMANDAQIDPVHSLTYLATADGLTVCGYGNANGVVEPCTSYVRGLLPSQDIRSVLRMQEGASGLDSLLIGTAQGLLVADAAAGSNRGIPLLRGRTIYDMIALSGRAVIATDRGLYALTPSTLVASRVATNTLPNNALRGLAAGSDGSLWIASDSGLVHYLPSTGQVTVFGVPEGLGSIQTRAVAVQSVSLSGITRDVIWVATAAGVARLDSATSAITRFTTADGLPSNDVLAVHVLANGTKLFGTARGLGHYLGD